MMLQVMDDTRGNVRWMRRTTCTIRRWTLTACTLGLLAGVTAQVGAAELQVRVKETPSSGQRLVIPISRSAIIETSAPIVRTDAVESAIARVEPISPTQLLVTGVGYGTTQILLWTEDGTQQSLEVNVELDLSRLNDMLTQLDPLGDAEAVSVRGTILLTGTISDIGTSERMADLAALFVPTEATDPAMFVQNHLRIPGEQQVLLRCTVAEVNRRAMRQLGVNGFMAGDDFTDAFVVNQIGGINPANIGAAADVNVQSTIPFLTGADGIPLSSTVPLSIGFPRVQMQLFIQALAENSLLKVLAEPDLVSVSGETASFLAGGEFPIPVPQSGAATGAVTIDFREFGVRVNFTPLVLGQERIRLKVAPEVSETDFSNAVQIQGFVVPGLTQRRVETTVEVGSGQTIAVAGLLSEEIRGIANRVPGIGDVPILGALFRSVEYQRSQTELVILVTPEIIAPVNPQQIMELPGENIATPTDYELYALGLLEGDVPDDGALMDPSAAFRTDWAPSVAPLRSQPEELSVHGPWGYSTVDDVQ